MRRMAALVGTLVSIGGLIGAFAVPAGAGGRLTTVLEVRKVVSGPATSGTTVVVECEAVEPTEGVGAAATQSNTLGFDATGKPTTATGDGAESWEIVDGAWVLTVAAPPAELDEPICTATETETGGAASTSWTCEFTFDAGTEPEGLGCAAEAGTGVGPVAAAFGDVSEEIVSQAWTVVFTNTYAAPVVEVVPTFTG